MMYYIKFIGGPWNGIEEEVNEIKSYYLAQYPVYDNIEILGQIPKHAKPAWK